MMGWKLFEWLMDDVRRAYAACAMLSIAAWGLMGWAFVNLAEWVAG